MTIAAVLRNERHEGEACKHTHARFMPDFPGDALICPDCLAELPAAGYSGGVRDYYRPGDRPLRRHMESLKRQWACGTLQDSILQCPACLYIGIPDNFDVMGADDGNVFCPDCQTEFEAVECNWERLTPAGKPEQQSLFAEDRA